MSYKLALFAGVCGLPIHAQASGLSLANDYNGGIALKAAVALRLWRFKADGLKIIEKAANANA